ncbi:hypothetical protein J6590_005643 [Homalodisca vitripennis]|nr:hypothetical protein J6590_005643 [Homalodisca vitripennis]
MENQGRFSDSDDDFELPEDRRMTRVLSPDEIQYPNSDDDTYLENTHPRQNSPRPESMCKALEGMTSEQVQELLHKLHISDESSQDEAIPPEKENVVEQTDGKDQVKLKKKKAPAKKVTKGNTKNNKTEFSDQSAEQIELPPVENVALEETKTKKTKRGKKDIAAPENVSVPASDHNITSKVDKKDVDEEINMKSKKKVTKSKQNSAKEIGSEDHSVLPPKEESNSQNEDNKQESENGNKTKKTTKKGKQTENVHADEPKEDDKKQQNTKVVANNGEKEKPGRLLKKSKDEPPVENEVENASEGKKIGENKLTKQAKGKQKNAMEVLKGNNESKEKESDSIIAEEPNKGRAKRNAKKETKDVEVDELEQVKEVQKSKKKVNSKQKENEDPDKNEPKSKPAPKTNSAKEKKIPTNKKEDKIKEEEVPATKRATRRTVK